MDEFYERTGMLIGQDGVEKLKNARVAVFGVGGVGGFAAEALGRAGVGHLLLVDNDMVSESNRNRQIIALKSTVGRLKTEVMKERLLDINPEADVEIKSMFYLPGNADEIDLSRFDYIIDAVDTVTAKLEIITRAHRLGVPVISAMGAGNKLHPERFEIADIYSTSICPLARNMRKELKNRGIDRLKCVYSKEEPVTTQRPPGSISFVPSAAGLIMAGEVVRDLLGAD